MTNLVRWEPFSELRNTMESLFDQGFARQWRFLPETGSQSYMPVDIWETEAAMELKAAIPGVRPDAVDISVVGDVLTIKAEPEQGEEQHTYYRREIPYGASFTRSFSLPVPVEADKAEARYEHGLLYLRLPKAEAVRPRQIRISSGTNGHTW